MEYYICSQCHVAGRPARKKRGSGKVEFSLWLAFPLNLPYTLWRMATKYNVCAACGSTLLIAENSIVGQRLLAKMEEGAAPILGQAKRMEREAIAMSAAPHKPINPAPTPLSALEEEKAFFAARTPTIMTTACARQDVDGF